MTEVVSDIVPSYFNKPYRNIRLAWDQELGILYVRMCVRPIQCFSLAAMSELQQILYDINANPGIVRHFVVASDIPGVFNFGGDLSLFVLLIRAKDLDSLRLYAKRCIDLVWWSENAAQRGIHTVALVQGDALGGGLESALFNHTVIFERGAQAGFPEILFNLFPGMGAWNLVTRKANYSVANEMILSGRVYTADQMYRRGLADVVVDDGGGQQAVVALAKTMAPHFRGSIAALKARRLAAPITFEALEAIVDHWAVTALSLSNRDMRCMDRLARAQVRKGGGASEGAVEEIKRIELDTAWGVERTGQSEWATLQ